MPVIHVELYEGRTGDTKQKIVAGITDVFIKEGVPPEVVTVILTEIKKGELWTQWKAIIIVHNGISVANPSRTAFHGQDRPSLL